MTLGGDSRKLCGLVAFVFLAAGSAARARGQEDGPMARPWWVEGDFGAGGLQLSSDQAQGSRKTTLAMGFLGGQTLGSRARAGLQLNGWLLQAYNLNDPTVGESVSTSLAVVDVFPAPKVPLFLRAGTGWASYTNNRPEGYGGGGWAWMAGAGYEIRIGNRLGLSPILAYSAGHLGDVREPTTLQTRRRFSVIESKIGISWHFGKPKQK